MASQRTWKKLRALKHLAQNEVGIAYRLCCPILGTSAMDHFYESIYGKVYKSTTYLLEGGWSPLLDERWLPPPAPGPCLIPLTQDGGLPPRWRAAAVPGKGRRGHRLPLRFPGFFQKWYFLNAAPPCAKGLSVTECFKPIATACPIPYNATHGPSECGLKQANKR